MVLPITYKSLGELAFPVTIGCLLLMLVLNVFLQVFGQTKLSIKGEIR